jgi:hypothetical protein
MSLLFQDRWMSFFTMLSETPNSSAMACRVRVPSMWRSMIFWRVSSGNGFMSTDYQNTKAFNSFLKGSRAAFGGGGGLTQWSPERPFGTLPAPKKRREI